MFQPLRSHPALPHPHLTLAMLSCFLYVLITGLFAHAVLFPLPGILFLPTCHWLALFSSLAFQLQGSLLRRTFPKQGTFPLLCTLDALFLLKGEVFYDRPSWFCSSLSPVMSPEFGTLRNICYMNDLILAWLWIVPKIMNYKENCFFHCNTVLIPYHCPPLLFLQISKMFWPGCFSSR